VAAAVVAGAALAAAAAAPRWAPPALARLSFFRVRQVEVEGLRYAPAAEIAARLGADTAASVWRDLAPLAARVRAHPLVAAATVERRLPGVLVVRVSERRPVAAAVAGAGLALYDSAGALLPVAPAAAATVDVPLVSAPDPALLRTLAELRAAAPAVYARVSEARRLRGGRPELVFALAPAAVPAAPRAGANAAAPAAAPPTAVLMRAAPGVAAARFADAALVERDLARRGVRPLELDLRFRDQVVARLP
jgi:cell division protein FtsQ